MPHKNAIVAALIIERTAEFSDLSRFNLGILYSMPQ